MLRGRGVGVALAGLGAGTWLAVYMWRRGLFEVQYDGMSAEEKAHALACRRAAGGFSGGMPVGAAWCLGRAISSVGGYRSQNFDGICQGKCGR